jgi:hypothetical protein
VKFSGKLFRELQTTTTTAVYYLAHFMMCFLSWDFFSAHSPQQQPQFIDLGEAGKAMHGNFTHSPQSVAER